MAYATPPKGIAGPVGQGDYIVAEGDCLESIAMDAGMQWETLWNHPRNAALKRARVCPNVLAPGDRLHVPEKTLKTLDRPTDQKHRFVLESGLCKLRICIQQAGEPRRNQAYVLELDDPRRQAGTRHQGKTDGDGWIDIPIPADASQGKLTVGSNPHDQRVFVLELGGMDPVTECLGIQKRLHNLGFSCEATGIMDDATSSAIAMFQEGEDLEATGELNDRTVDALKKRHGS